MTSVEASERPCKTDGVRSWATIADERAIHNRHQSVRQAKRRVSKVPSREQGRPSPNQSAASNPSTVDGEAFFDSLRQRGDELLKHRHLK